jgi:hypothetical protein
MASDIEVIQAYSALFKKFEEAGLTATIEGGKIRIADDVCAIGFFDEFKVADAWVAGFLFGKKLKEAK